MCRPKASCSATVGITMRGVPGRSPHGVLLRGILPTFDGTPRVAPEIHGAAILARRAFGFPCRHHF